MAEIFLSATIKLLIEKLSGELIDFACREGVDTSVKKLREKLVMILDVLADAEEMQIRKESVKMWLQDLRELAFDAEDVLDELATEAKRCELKAESETSSNSKVQSLCIPFCFEPKALKFNFTIKSKIEKITTRFQEIEEQKRSLNLNLLGNAGTMSNRTRETPVNMPMDFVSRQTTSLLEPNVRGRDKDKEAIVEELLGGEASDDGLRVISIIAMGGAGKTTLAQLVYNDERVKASFDPMAWVCVYEHFDLVQLTKAMLNSFTKQTSRDKDLELLQNSLKEKLSKQKFLLVLDDVWPDKHKIDWTNLSKPLCAGAPGSRIIVTTRNTDVSSIKAMGINAQDYHLKALSHEDTKAIFFHHAFETRDLDAHPSLKEIGEKIVLERCKGLPLAAKALGGLLRTKVDPKEWEYVLNSQIWALPEDKCGIIPALRLSYHHLPAHLKPCFAFCSIYPEDYEFRQEELVLLWMATGLVQQRLGERKSMEDVGAEYFRDLLSRSFFQRSSVTESQFVMHDLVNDLAQWAAGETCFRLEDKKQPEVSKKTRHSSYFRSYLDGVKKFKAFYEFESLRTFLSIHTLNYGGYLTRNVPFDLLLKLRCLRVLSLGGYQYTELPESIGNLKHLRYLDLSGSEIRSLPRSTSTLYNLQTLILKYCSRLETLPTEMGNLTDLRHLNIRYADSLKEMPQQIGKLKSLRKLSNFIIGDDSGSARIGELMNLKFLSGTLCISSIEKVMDDHDALNAMLKDKQDLDVLTLQYSGEFNASRKERVEEEVLNMLEPPQQLIELYIKYYGGTTLPTWLGNPSFSNMVVLRLENCAKCTSLPPLGQLPSLKDLFIQGMKEVKRVGIEFYGLGCAKYFPTLKILRFVNMEVWEDWVDCFSSEIDGQVEVFPCLREVCIENCPKLSGKLPDHLPSLEKMFIHECPQLTVSISSHPEPYEIYFSHRQENVWGSVRSLEYLALSDISKISFLTEAFVQGLTKIKYLRIVGCNELSSLWKKEEGLLQHLTSLCDRLTIDSCPKFVSLGTEEEIEQQQHQPMLPLRLESLELDRCENLDKLQGLHSLTSLRKLTIRSCPKLVALLEKRDNSSESLLEELYIEECSSLTSLSLSSRGELPTTLKCLDVRNCPKLEFVVERFHHNMFLEEISIDSCENLKSLPEDMHNLTRLSQLNIYQCPSLVSFPDGGLPTTNLRYLCVSNCDKLKALPDCIHNLTSLETLEILECGGIVSFPNGGLPATNLTSLKILKCEKLEVLPHLQNLTSLQDLSIRNCPRIVSFPNGGLPATNLRDLYISDCEKLNALPDCIYNLTSLETLEILECGGIVSFPNGGLPATNLTRLQIWKCEKLEVLPHLQNLTSLQYLDIRNCPGIVSFPEEGFPTSLTSLHIIDLKILHSIMGLRRLTSLKRLVIGGPYPDLMSFPEENDRMMLPTSLSDLTITDFPNLKYLSSKVDAFQNLTSLESLRIHNCPKLKFFPKKGLPLSLLVLSIDNCPKLKFFPKKGLPLLLLELHITNCPLLEQRYKRDQGRDWPKIAHIPCVNIHDSLEIAEEE